VFHISRSAQSSALLSPVPMAKHISQETFDAVVRENMAEFDMAPDDAVADAIAQFTAQGASLAGILLRDPSAPPAAEGAQSAESAAASTLASSGAEVLAALAAEAVAFAGSADGCGRDVLAAWAERLHAAVGSSPVAAADAGKRGLVVALVAAMARSTEDSSTSASGVPPPAVIAALRNLLALAPENRDQLGPTGIAVIVRLARTVAAALQVAQLPDVDPDLAPIDMSPQSLGSPDLPASQGNLWASVSPILGLLQIACVRNELNRQKAAQLKIIPLAVALLDKATDVVRTGSEHSEAAIDVAAAVARLMRILVLNDDATRTLISKSVENTVEFVSHGALRAIVDAVDAVGARLANAAVSAFAAGSSATPTASAGKGGAGLEEDESSVGTEALAPAAELLFGMGRLCIRNEYCIEAARLGAVGLVDRLVSSVSTSSASGDIGVLAGAFFVYRNLAGNDECKAVLARGASSELLLGVLQERLDTPRLVENGLAALSALTLRSQDNVDRLVRLGAASVVIGAMRALPGHAPTQRWACMVLRNMVSRNKDITAAILEEGAEPLLRKARSVNSMCDDAAKAALRDMGCSVELQELFKGNPMGLREYK
jgi:hypothetical protein